MSDGVTNYHLSASISLPSEVSGIALESTKWSIICPRAKEAAERWADQLQTEAAPAMLLAELKALPAVRV
jgi:hypothetical protein